MILDELVPSLLVFIEAAVLSAALFAEETGVKAQLAETPQHRCMAAVESGTERSDPAFAISRKNDQVRTSVTVSIPASSVALSKAGARSEAFLTWFIVQREPSGKQFGERFRQNGVKISQTLISSDDAMLQFTVCDTESGLIGSRSKVR